ncbi:MAG TPA: phosphatidylglycerol lysyltransferase domain-containing protein [Solirubrobacteraceae bacterium]
MLAIEAILAGVAGRDMRQPTWLGRISPAELPSQTHVLSVLVGLALLTTAPRLWRGTRTAVSLAMIGLTFLAALNAIKGRYAEAGVEMLLVALLAAGRNSFRLGCRNRPRLAIVCAAVGAWGLSYCALLVAPIAHGHSLLPGLHHSVTHSLRLAGGPPRVNQLWSTLIEVMIACAAAISVLAIRSLLRPGKAENAHDEHEHRSAQAIVDAHGQDSLSPFVLRPDKALLFAAGGMLSYRVIGGTAIVSSDPVAPGDNAPRVLEAFLMLARRNGWQPAVWGASDHHLEAYHSLGLRAICVGEEAFVDPARFTLQGRAVRKLRQSVHRMERRGWEITVRDGREIDERLEAEMDELEVRWRSGRRRLIGFAMGMGPYEAELRPDDLYVLARSPSGELGALMRFASHCGKLSLDTMRRVGPTPNGLNEALVCRALAIAHQRGVSQVSLNYAGLAHLVRPGEGRSGLSRWAVRLLMALLSRRFQMKRLVAFNQKFSPQWRRRYLVYESTAALPRTVVRVLQVEGYIPERPRLRLPRGPLALPRALPQPPQATGAR